MQRRYDSAELQGFLKLVDAELQRPCTLVLVGGAALSLGYCPAQTATEFEVWSCTDDRFWTATERASAKIARPIATRQVRVGDARLAFEPRTWSPAGIELRYLTVLLPEAHDHLILKIAQSEPTDFAGSLHRAHPLSPRTLAERYRELTSQLLARRQRFNESFLGVVERLFGAAEAAAIRTTL